jgi:hypothetical protein
MRTPFKGSDYFCEHVNAAFEKVEKTYLDAITPAIAMRKANAMLGDGTVAEIDTFEPQNVRTFYQWLATALKDWVFSGISKSATEDLHRLYCQFTKDVGRYYIYGYFGIQFHALPYYRMDKRVIEIQKELAKIADDATLVFRSMTGAANAMLEAELQKKGYADMEFQELFSKMFDDEKLVEELDKKATVVESQFPEFEAMGKRKSELFGELNNLLIELYQTSPVSIDYNRLMQGEEGVTTYFDIEVIKNKKTKKRDAFLDTPKIAKQEADAISAELGQIAKALQKSSQ